MPNVTAHSMPLQRQNYRMLTTQLLRPDGNSAAAAVMWVMGSSFQSVTRASRMCRDRVDNSFPHSLKATVGPYRPRLEAIVDACVKTVAVV
jgi:hypothetical protein